jgi:hypothetical protein
MLRSAWLVDQNIEVTTHNKVDLSQLYTVARPWPVQSMHFALLMTVGLGLAVQSTSSNCLEARGPPTGNQLHLSGSSPEAS